MTKRYDTLDVSLNLNNSALKTPKKLANTIDLDNSISSNTQNDERVNKFRDLYYKNQKLRNQLKLLNVKLNERLQRIKLKPNKAKKAQSVDFQRVPPSKALQRQLENAYKQVAMYKKQISSLKVKQQSETTYQKYKNLQNAITFKDLQISQVQAELTSIKNIKKMQQKTLDQDLQNQDLKQKLNDYQRQFKQSQDKLKDIAKKARKRQYEYKRQQAYLVALQKKLRGGNAQQQPEEQIYDNKNIKKQQQFTEQDFKKLKAQILQTKQANQVLQKKCDINKKAIRDLKKRRIQYEEKLSAKQKQLGAFQLKQESYSRYIKDVQKKKNEATTNFDTNFMKEIQIDTKHKNLLKLEEISLSQQEGDDKSSLVSKQKAPFQMSNPASSIHPGQRQWNGKSRKVSFGYMDSKDTIFNQTGNLKGLKLYIDQNNLISGICFIYSINNSQRETSIQGTKTQNQLKWELQSNDLLSKLSCSFTQQGYLSSINIITKNNINLKLGSEASDKFNLPIQKNQFISGFYCGIRRLGQDTRVTQIGFWISKE